MGVICIYVVLGTIGLKEKTYLKKRQLISTEDP